MGNVRFLEDNWIYIAPTTNKWSKFMSIFKRKKKGNVRFCSPLEETEREYTDRKFKALLSEIEKLSERIEILETVNKNNYILINSVEGMWDEKKDLWINPYKAKIWAKENGYSYVESFNTSGELWVKEEKK